jgi:putative toxin-antitoxin system antitoxin component (TIGR02293 family)
MNVMADYPLLDKDEELTYSSLSQSDNYSIVQAVREGLPYYAFENYVSKSPFSLGEWSDLLGLSARSLQRYKKDNKPFDKLHSDRIIEIVLVLRKGIEVFGDEKKFAIWMNSNIVALGGIKPKELLDSSFGIRLLNDELTRIAYGIFA